MGDFLDTVRFRGRSGLLTLKGPVSILFFCLLAGACLVSILGVSRARRPPSHSSAFAAVHYRHPPTTVRAELCTEDQLRSITSELLSPSADEIHRLTHCPIRSWIEDFYREGDGGDGGDDAARDADLTRSDEYGSFLGISVGCNKGYDAIDTARMGFGNPNFDREKWADGMIALGMRLGGICGQRDAPQFELGPGQSLQRRAGSAGGGEMHCIEPMPATFEKLDELSTRLGLKGEGFRTTWAAISSTDGSIAFPNGKAGKEDFGLGACDNPKYANRCVEVPMYSLQTYVENFVASRGPINILSIDVEGFDFDVLFGAGSVLDRTQYLEFEYHFSGSWGGLHLPDAVRLLDSKGFTCYWSGVERLWRITGCIIDDTYNTYHQWSNVACVHRSQSALTKKMEDIFLSGLQIVE
mmetsp:Transcript_52068/g.156238  ORF Transcript_52068/g.156238 Transcript_52068/m.156238 type:complete len:411 (-) Transcript_52068:112-1344(-)